MPDVEVVDYGGGNLGSLLRCLHRLGLTYQLVDQHNHPTGCRPLILPGVGAFGAVAKALSQGELDRRVVEVVENGTPFLGICVGLQILLDSSEESPGVRGLGIVPGEVRRFRAPKVPQIGWNEVVSKEGSSGFVYFVNSYYAVPFDSAAIWYESDYYGAFCAAVRDRTRGRNVSAFQFHPEKSGEFGQRLLFDWYKDTLAKG